MDGEQDLFDSDEMTVNYVGVFIKWVSYVTLC
jgi:hypothetical protein